jgi:hypothetical protein
VRSDGKIVVVAINQLEWEHGGLRRFLSYAGGRLVDTLSPFKYPRIIVAAQVLRRCWTSEPKLGKFALFLHGETQFSKLNNSFESFLLRSQE